MAAPPEMETDFYFLDLAIAKSLQSTRMVTDADADDDADDDDDV